LVRVWPIASANSRPSPRATAGLLSTTTLFSCTHITFLTSHSHVCPLFSTFNDCITFRAEFTNSGQLAGLLNADYFKPTAKSYSHFTNKSELLPNSSLLTEWLTYFLTLLLAESQCTPPVQPIMESPARLSHHRHRPPRWLADYRTRAVK